MINFFTAPAPPFFFRQSYDIDIELEAGNSGVHSTNRLDLKNPFFHYTGQQPAPPTGSQTTSPSDNYWSQIPAATTTTLNGYGDTGNATHLQQGLAVQYVGQSNLIPLGKCFKGLGSELPLTHPRLEKPVKMGFSMPGNLANSREISNAGREIEFCKCYFIKVTTLSMRFCPKNNSRNTQRKTHGYIPWVLLTVSIHAPTPHN